MAPVIIRDATAADAEVCAAIYAPYVLQTSVSFEIEPPTPEQMAARIASASAKHAWMVLVVGERRNGANPSAVREPTDEGVDGQVVGYAYAHPFAERAAYRWCCEVSIYLERERHRSGGGRRLYEALLARLADRGYRRAMAGMTMPNDASAGFHQALGFEPVGVYRRVGWKHGAWHDVAWVQKTILDANDPPAEPR
jgi:L-amino acid N-acyltransferase YncA